MTIIYDEYCDFCIDLKNKVEALESQVWEWKKEAILNAEGVLEVFKDLRKLEEVINQRDEQIKELKGQVLAAQMLENVAQENAHKLREEVKDLKQEIKDMGDSMYNQKEWHP